ncbi:MAG: hypothetical protein JOZ45_13060 [Acidobacteriaceae bacterium]|nr:hypothetical protein [Acidobacteriaceae bacterium]
MPTDDRALDLQANGCRVTCHVGPSHDLYHLSKVLSGLGELAAAGSVKLRLEPIRGAAESSPQCASLYASIEGISAVFDVYDASNHFEIDLLEHCNIYFKRSFFPTDLQLLPAELRAKIVPFGLNYACRSATAEPLLLASGINTVMSRYQETRTISEFEQSPDAPVLQSIVFQTRAWAPDSTGDNVEEVNESRAGIIRALRKNFPRKFAGGFVFSPYAQQRYPDLISTYPSEESAYCGLCKNQLIGVSTRGLHRSVPFKIPEYMATSLAIVSEPLRNELPVPFISGRDFLEFHTSEECVEQCERILSRHSLAEALREASWRYYESEVRPAMHIANLLKRSLGHVT